MHDEEVDVDIALVRALLDQQMPEYSQLSLHPVEPWGTDNAVYRLGGEFVVRLPRIEWAAGLIELEMKWLPWLAPRLPVAVPEPVRVGQPGIGYPYTWAVHRWLPGVPATLDRLDDPVKFALDLAEVVAHLRVLPIDNAPPARGRACPLRDYDDDARRAIHTARHLIDADVALAVWEQALAAEPHTGDPVWVHGDLDSNCLVDHGRLTGIVDWGYVCAGDPAVDVQAIWTPLFNVESRQAFIETLAIDDATLARSKGAAIHSACAALPYYLDTYPQIVERSRHKLTQLGVNLQLDGDRSR